MIVAETTVEARYLPRILQDLAEIIGLAATLRLVEAYGGVRLYVPKRFDPDHPIVKLIGHAPAVLLVEAYGGEAHFDIPRAIAATRAVRDNGIRRDRDFGASHRELALRNGLTERQIRNILGDEEDDRQVGLF